VTWIYRVFDERSLKVIPSYVRKLIHSIVEIKKGFRYPNTCTTPCWCAGPSNSWPRTPTATCTRRVVDRMDRQVQTGRVRRHIKDIFSEMANNCLYYNVEEEKGVVLNGPPGGGKTFLVRTWLSENKDVHDIATSASALQDPANPIDGAVENLEKLFDIAKMIAPTVVFFDEGDALAPRRSASGGSPTDKLTNKFPQSDRRRDPLHRVFTVLTTNRLDILDPALVRSKRLKVMDITGSTGKRRHPGHHRRDAQRHSAGQGSEHRNDHRVGPGPVQHPGRLCRLSWKRRGPAQHRIRGAAALPPNGGHRSGKGKFHQVQLKTLMGIVEAIDARRAACGRSRSALPHWWTITRINDDGAIRSPTVPADDSHLQSAKQEISQSPTKKGKVQLDEFLEAELSQEPQVGFIIGVGANDVTGVLLPIATSLTYRVSTAMYWSPVRSRPPLRRRPNWTWPCR
jgi:transitional endoplasmic reticulum ATPase